MTWHHLIGFSEEFLSDSKPRTNIEFLCVCDFIKKNEKEEKKEGFLSSPTLSIRMNNNKFSFSSPPLFFLKTNPQP